MPNLDQFSEHEHTFAAPQQKHKFSKSWYISAVSAALRYISAGDIYQVNLATSFDSPWTANPTLLFERLAGPLRTGAPYAAFIPPSVSPSGCAICSASPELFLSVRRGVVITRPIKGTQATGTTPESLAAARRTLESSEKERAELNMIVDLERNDLGRVCDFGSVRVDSPGEIETFPHLLHRTATVSGQLKSGTTLGDLLTATFPGGSITGTPKLRAMEIIAELEPTPRGPYCGAIGWLGCDGSLELSIAIRTATVDPVQGVARYFAGAGIVADSNPQAEYDEVLLKAESFFAATRSAP